MIVRKEAQIFTQDGCPIITQMNNRLVFALRDQKGQLRFAIVDDNPRFIMVVDRHRPRNQSVVAVIVIAGPLPISQQLANALVLDNVVAWDCIDGDDYDR